MAQKRPAESAPEQTDRKTRKRSKTPAGWKLSRSNGGRILPVDPIFSHDGETIIVAHSLSVSAYSTKTALLVRSLDLRTKTGFVTGLAASPDESSEIYISTDSGWAVKWDWASGVRADIFNLERPIWSIIYARSLGSNQGDALLTVEDAETTDEIPKGTNSGSSHQISMHCLNLETLSVISKVIRKGSAINELKCLNRGKLLVASSGKEILIGRLHGDLSPSSINTLSYRWHGLTTPNKITCLDVRLQRSSKSLDADIAVGSESGSIHIYFKLVSSLRNAEKRQNDTRPSEQKLHWHRYPVRALRFSKDGNYLMSGGLETVLCNWQLDTGRRHDIPHLTASIDRLALSLDGASYAVNLGNNSLVLLSALDLKTVFTLSGPTLPASQARQSKGAAFPALVKPDSSHGQLLLAVPSSCHHEDELTPSAVYLQTIDTRTGQELEKQALTRNNATDRISDPLGRAIREPEITHLAISHDCDWLATAESWRPPSPDSNNEGNATGDDPPTQRRAEIFLKFWKRNKQTKTWELSARIENPHGNHLAELGTIFDMVACPNGFQTIGADGQIKTWTETSRRRDNMQVKDREGNPLTNWQCTSSMAAPPRPVVDEVESALLDAKLVNSDDGSLTIAALQYQSSTVLCTMDCHSKSMISVRNDLALGVIHGICIVDRFLVVLSEDLLVWDLVMDRLHFSYFLKYTRSSKAQFSNSCHLAHDASGQFAVITPNKKGNASQLVIFNTGSTMPVSLQELPSRAQGLYALPSSRGYVIIDEQAEVCELTKVAVNGSAPSVKGGDAVDLGKPGEAMSIATNPDSSNGDNVQNVSLDE